MSVNRKSVTAFAVAALLAGGGTAYAAGADCPGMGSSSSAPTGAAGPSTTTSTDTTPSTTTTTAATRRHSRRHARRHSTRR